MRTAFLLPLLALFASCATHNSHRIDLVPTFDLEPLAREALGELEDDYGQPLPPLSTAFAVELEELDLNWVVTDDEAGTASRRSNEEVRLVLEDLLVDQLGPSLVSTDRIDEAELRLDAWLLLDLHDLDRLGMQLVTVLTHRDRPERVLAEGYSKLTRLPRLRCFGCRDDWGMDEGSRLRRDRPVVRGRNVVGPGWWLWGGGVWLRSWGGGATYFKGRRR